MVVETLTVSIEEKVVWALENRLAEKEEEVLVDTRSGS